MINGFLFEFIFKRDSEIKFNSWWCIEHALGHK